MLAKKRHLVNTPFPLGMRENTDARLTAAGEGGTGSPKRKKRMSQSLECPRCHCRAEASGSGWPSRSCPHCGSPLVLASAPAQILVRRYLNRDRPAPMGTPPPSGRRG